MIISYEIRKGKNKERCDDSALIGTEVANNASGVVFIDTPGWVCLGDGVGGNAGGNEASMFVMNGVLRIPPTNDCETLKRKLIEVNDCLSEYSATIPGYENMATTFTGLYFGTHKTILSHCGNTRLYSLQGKYLKQITTDQTAYQWLISINNLEAAKNCNRSEIIGAFGGGNKQYIKSLIVESVFQHGIPKRILLTSDGIHDVLEIDDIEELMISDLPAQEKIRRLIDLSVEKGSLDDCSAIVIEQN